MRLFLYGSLLDDAVLTRQSGTPGLARRGVAATLPGWRRVPVPRSRWPTLRRARRGIVTGCVIDLPAQALARLSAYEGPGYRLTRLVVTVANRRSTAWAWIAPVL